MQILIWSYRRFSAFRVKISMYRKGLFGKHDKLAYNLQVHMTKKDMFGNRHFLMSL